MFMQGRQRSTRIDHVGRIGELISIVIELLTDEAPVNRRRRVAPGSNHSGRCLPPRNLRHPQAIKTGAFDEGRVEEGSGAGQRRDMTADARHPRVLRLPL